MRGDVEKSEGVFPRRILLFGHKLHAAKVLSRASIVKYFHIGARRLHCSIFSRQRMQESDTRLNSSLLSCWGKCISFRLSVCCFTQPAWWDGTVWLGRRWLLSVRVLALLHSAIPLRRLDSDLVMSLKVGHSRLKTIGEFGSPKKRITCSSRLIKPDPLRIKVPRSLIKQWLEAIFLRNYYRM
jgi:hypothetical protein